MTVYRRFEVGTKTETDANINEGHKSEDNSKFESSFGHVVIFPNTYDHCGYFYVFRMSVYALLSRESLAGKVDHESETEKSD